MSVPSSQSSDRKLLPTNVKPLNYNIVLTPNFEDFTFLGESLIDIFINQDSNSITLHGLELELTSASLSISSGSLNSKQIEHNEKEQTFKLIFEEFKKDQKAVLKLYYKGILNDKMNGFYRSQYIDNKGNKKYMISTQFESTDARKAFPCFDEPSLKATFEIALKVDKTHTALSNMNVIDEIIEEEKKLVKFAKSPVMSTYLVAFAVGEFDYIEDYTQPDNEGNKVKCRVYTTKGLSNQGRFALNVALRTLDLFNKIFAIPYPLPKLDMLAVPDFDAGAMENWGLVTYRTVLLLYDENKSAAKSKQRIASVVAHELAHQWFGNLVTMEWWSHLWLNEGFATWVGTYAVDALFPEWNTWTQFFTDDMARGLQLDSLRSSHPIEVEVNEASEISQIFDAISYSKGASVIRMLSTYLGEDTFLEGIRLYLKKHAYSNASTKDLWTALSDVSKKDVSKFMELWTTKIGYPLIEITSGQKSINIKQSRYLSAGDPTSEEDSTVWWVPLRYVVGSSESPSNETKVHNEILESKESSIQLDAQASSTYYKFNRDQTGVYRVKYPTEQIQLFGKLISSSDSNTHVLTSLDKIGLVSDITSLSQSGQGNITDFLELLKNFENERDYLVLSEISSTISKMLSVWFEEDENVIGKLKQLRKNVFGHLVKEIGWDAPSDEEKKDPLAPMLRSLAISNAGLSGDKAVIEEARKRFDEFMNGNHGSISADIKGAVFSIILHEGNEQDFELVKKNYLETEIADQKMIALSALGATTNKELINKALDFSISADVRNQDIIYIMSSLGSNTKARRITYDFIKAHWGLFESKYKTNMSILGSLIKYSASLLTKDEDAEDLQSFFKNKDTKPVERALNQSLESIRSNHQWLIKERENVSKWLTQNQ